MSEKDEIQEREDIEKELIELRIRLAERELFEKQQEWASGRLRLERRKLETILNALPNGVHIISHDYQILFGNQWMEKRFRGARGKRCFAEYANRTSPCPGCPVRSALAKGRSAVAEFRFRSRYYEIIAAPLGEFDNLTAAVVNVLDFTVQRKTEEAILSTQRKYGQLLNELNTGIYVSTVSRNSRFVEVNPATINMFDASSREELLNVETRDLCPDKAHRIRFISKLLRKGFVKDAELPLISLRGRRFWASVTAIKKQGEDNQTYFEGVIEDITQRKNAEELVQCLNERLKTSNRRLRKLTLRDDRTGLYNEIYLEKWLDFELARARRFDYPVSLLQIEPSESEREAFDREKRGIGRILRRHLRGYDVLGSTKTGFLVICPRSDAEKTESLKNRLAGLLGEEPVPGLRTKVVFCSKDDSRARYLLERLRE